MSERGSGAPHHGDTFDERAGRDPLGLDEHSPTARERFDAVSQPIRDRFEQPISTVSSLTQKNIERWRSVQDDIFKAMCGGAKRDESTESERRT